MAPSVKTREDELVEVIEDIKVSLKWIRDMVVSLRADGIKSMLLLGVIREVEYGLNKCDEVLANE